MKRCFCFLIFFVFVYVEGLIEKFQICKRSDPKLNDCLKDAIQKALPIIENDLSEYNIPSMQPIEISTWIVKKNPVLQTFEQTYTDIKIYNLASSTVKDIQASITDSDFSLMLKLYNPLIKFVALYDYRDAVLAGYDLSGRGRALFVDLGNDIQLNITGEVNSLGDKAALHLTSVTLDISVDKMDVNLDHDHLELNRQTNEHLSKNSHLLFDSLNRGFTDMILDDIKTVTSSIFEQLDYNKLFPK